MQKREQRNKSLQSNAMSRYNSYKLINEKYSYKVANYEWKMFTKAQAVWLVIYKYNVSKSHTCVHELVSYIKYKSRIKKSSIIDLGAGLLIGYSRVYLFYYVFGSFKF